MPINFSFNKDKVEKVIEASRKNYAVAYKTPIIKKGIKKTENPVKNINSEEFFIKND
jgi:hypothetical protein